MHDSLRLRLEKIKEQIESLYSIEEKYLTLESAKDHQLSLLMIQAEGSSQAAKEMHAKASPQWLEFTKALAMAESAFHREKHLLDLKLKAYDAEHLSTKLDSAVPRGS